MTEHASISLPFADSSQERIAACGHGNCAMLRMLAGFLRLPILQEEDESPAVMISEELPTTDGWEEWTGVTGFKGRILWMPDTFRFHFQIPPAKRYAIVPIIRRAFNLASLRRTLFGRTTFVHGALLLFKEAGTATVLFGHSGIGKSTASERFIRQGGSCLSDDKMLLSFHEDGRVLAQPTPTWSRFGVRELDVDFSSIVPVSSILWLSRGENDTIRAADPVQWRLTFVKSLSNVLEYPCNWLPQNVLRPILEKVISLMPEIERHFGAFELLGDLNGSIYLNLREFTNPVRQAPE